MLFVTIDFLGREVDEEIVGVYQQVGQIVGKSKHHESNSNVGRLLSVGENAIDLRLSQ